MEFDFTVTGLTSQQLTVWDAAALKRLSPEDSENFKKVLDSFGKRSAKAQGLNTAITDVHRLRATDQRLYLAATRHGGSTVVLGGLKAGSKKLFVRKVDGSLEEVEPVCVLDFYVHEDYQRKGVGKQLFEFFLSTERLQPDGVAYDRPSPKLLTFLAKHYGLHHFQPQNNNFVLFDSFWQLAAVTAGTKGRRGTAQPQQQGRSVSAIPPWVAGLPASSRPQVAPSSAALPPSHTQSPANTLTHDGPDNGWATQPSPTQHGPHGPTQTGWGADPGSPSAQGTSGHSMPAPRQFGRPPSFGRRGVQPLCPAAPPASDTAGHGAHMAAVQQVSVPAPRGDALDAFCAFDTGHRADDTGTAHRASQQQPLPASGVWSGAGQAGWGWQAPAGSAFTTQGPAHVYTAVPVPATGTGLPHQYQSMAVPHHGQVYHHADQQHHTNSSGHQAPAHTPLHTGHMGPHGGSHTPTAVHAQQSRACGAGGPPQAPHWQQPPDWQAGGRGAGLSGPRYTTPPWGQDGDEVGALGPRRLGSQQQWTPTPSQQRQHMPQQSHYRAVGAGVPATGASPAQLNSGPFGSKGATGSKPAGALTARDAALAARAGAGAAGCLVW